MPIKMIEALDDLKIRRAKPGTIDRKLFDGRGLFLLVKANGAKHWRFKYRFAGRERLLALGEYPDRSLAAARGEAGKARLLVRAGIDPVQQGRESRAGRVNMALQTFEVVAEEWLPMKAKSKKWTDGHIEQNRQSLKDHVFPMIGKRPISALNAQDAIRVLRPLEEAGKLETLRRVRQRMSAIFAYAVQTGRRPDNPIRDTHGAFEAPQREHFASLTAKDIPDFLRTLSGYQGHQNTITIVRMILWTACRTGEIRGATADEFDLDAGLWTIPGARMKKRRPHVVPLPRQAVELLKEVFKANADARYAIPSPMGDFMASENIVLQAIEKMGYGGRLTGHGVRAAVATGLEELGFATELIKEQLSHAKATLTDAAYLRGIHVDARADMMQTWANHLDQMERGGAVFPIRRKVAAAA